MAVAVKKKKRRSERGNWLIVTYIDGRIFWCKWVQTWAGVGMSRRESDKYVELYKARGRSGRVMVLDIERMVDYAVTEGANEISDLYKMFEKE